MGRKQQGGNEEEERLEKEEEGRMGMERSPKCSETEMGSRSKPQTQGDASRGEQRAFPEKD